jgi:hypothetical protein
MARFIKDRSAAKGQAPGSLIFTGKQKMEKPVIHLIEYDAKNLYEKEYPSVNEGVNNVCFHFHSINILCRYIWHNVKYIHHGIMCE